MTGAVVSKTFAVNLLEGERQRHAEEIARRDELMREDSRKIGLLTHENAQLKAEIERLKATR